MLYVFLIFLLSLFSSFSLKDKVAGSSTGDYIVTEQSKNYSLLFIRKIDPHILELEEISTTESQMKLIKNKWKEWVKKGAPGHTAWVVYTLDLTQNKMKRCYSFDRKADLHINEKDSFIAQLLSFRLNPIDLSQRKRIGPPPATDETDRRALWNPPLFIEGVKQEKPTLEVYRATWPKDDSPLSECMIDLYFDTKRPSFLFPTWIEVKNPHYTHNLRVVDSGTQIESPRTFLPSQTEELRKL